MDLLAEHEAFLRAIFDAPDDDTPRLIYADFLEENGDPERAEFIRAQCEFPRLIPSDLGDPEFHPRLHRAIALQSRLRRELIAARPDLFRDGVTYRRGFPSPPEVAEVSVPALDFGAALREEAVMRHPEWFGAAAVSLVSGRISTETQLLVLLESSVFARVTELHLRGRMEARDAPDSVDNEVPYFVQVPSITSAVVAALTTHHGVGRVTALDLRYNDLDNDAARALVKSPYLDNLKTLRLLEGNRLRGKVWQQVVARFGEDVAG